MWWIFVRFLLIAISLSMIDNIALVNFRYCLTSVIKWNCILSNFCSSWFPYAVHFHESHSNKWHAKINIFAVCSKMSNLWTKNDLYDMTDMLTRQWNCFTNKDFYRGRCRCQSLSDVQGTLWLLMGPSSLITVVVIWVAAYSVFSNGSHRQVVKSTDPLSLYHSLQWVQVWLRPHVGRTKPHCCGIGRWFTLCIPVYPPTALVWLKMSVII